MHGTDDGGWRDSSGFAEEKLNAVWARPFGNGALTLRLSGSNLDQQTAGFIIGQDAYRDPELARSNPDPEAYRDATSLRFTSQYQGASGNELRIYLRSSRMDFLQHFLLGQPIEKNGQDSGGFIFTTTGRAVAGGELIAGFDTELAPEQPSAVPERPDDRRPACGKRDPAGRQALRLRRGFGGASPGMRSGTVQLAPRWSLDAGLRLEHARYDYDNRMIDGNTDENGVPCPGGCLYSRPADRTDDFTNLAPRLGLVFGMNESCNGLSLACAGVSHAGGDRALSAATPAVRRRSRFRGRSIPWSSGSGGDRKWSRSTSRSFTWTRAT